MVKYLLVDGHNLAMRSVHASYGAELSSHGVPTAALLFFVNGLVRAIADEEPTHIAVAWDGQSKYRRNLLPSYKANRKSNLNPTEKGDCFLLMWAFLDAAGILSCRHEDYEADDLIAAWWQTPTEGHITIASSDKDFFQLLGPNPFGVPTHLLRFSSGSAPTDTWDDQRVREDEGFEPRCWPLVTALAGDVSDNIVGIPGIGPKRAVKLLKRHDWNLIEALQEFPEHRDRVLSNLKLVDLRSFPLVRLPPPRPVILPRYGDAGGELLDEFLDRFDLVGLRQRYHRHQLWSRPAIGGRPWTLAGRSSDGQP